MFWLLLVLYATNRSNEIGIVENSLAHFDDNTNRSEFEPRLLRGEENLCNFNIQEEVVSLSQNSLRFVSNACDILVYEIVDNFLLPVKTTNNDTALVQLKSEAVFDGQVVLESFWKAENKKRFNEHVFGKMFDWGFDHHQVFSPTQQKSISMVYDEAFLNTNLRYNTNEDSCHGDSGGRMLLVSGWGVGVVKNTTKTRMCHWPAFWLVVCPWYGIQHCQSK